MAEAKNITLISLVGRTASGKSTLAIKLARYLRTIHIEGSEVIQKSLGVKTKKEQAETLYAKVKEDPEWFGKELSKAIENKLVSTDREVVVVSGIRQIDTIIYLRKHYKYYGFEVRADMPVRYRRCIDDGKYRTADQFLQGEIRELDIGIQEAEDDAPFAIPTSPLTNPDRIVRATVRTLREKGATLR